MAWAELKFKLWISKIIVQYYLKSVSSWCSAQIHRWTHKPLASAQNIVIIGGSFCGVQQARVLTECVPTGYRVVMIEKNEAFHYSFNFPRYSVLEGHERKAFIPYDGVFSKAPGGSFELVRDEVVEVVENEVVLRSGKKLPFAYLAIATGSWQPSPSKLKAVDRREACEELRHLQLSVKAAETIAIVGGGAVGAELAGDIASYYPKKDVSLVHSRDHLLPRFDRKLHDHVVGNFRDLGIRMILGQRPQPSRNTGDEKRGSLRFSDGRVEIYDLVILCTGLKPNTSIIQELDPGLISKENGHILVQSTLQVACKDDRLRHIFSIGDVADTGGPKMARAAFYQTEVVRNNILSMIEGRPAEAVYIPQPGIEGALKLTLGKDQTVMYAQQDKGSDILIPGKGGSEDLEVERAWKMYGASLKDLPN